MTGSFTTVQAQMPPEGDVNNVGIYPERQVIVVGGHAPSARPYFMYDHFEGKVVPDIDVSSTYQRNGQLFTLTVPNPKAIKPSPKLLALLSRSVKKN